MFDPLPPPWRCFSRSPSPERRNFESLNFKISKTKMCVYRLVTSPMNPLRNLCLAAQPLQNGPRERAEAAHPVCECINLTPPTSVVRRGFPPHDDLRCVVFRCLLRGSPVKALLCVLLSRCTVSCVLAVQPRTQNNMSAFTPPPTKQSVCCGLAPCQAALLRLARPCVLPLLFKPRTSASPNDK